MTFNFTRFSGYGFMRLKVQKPDGTFAQIAGISDECTQKQVEQRFAEAEADYRRNPIFHKVGPRFVWLIGSVREEYADVPEPADNGSLVLWDRQLKQAVARVEPKYAQAICLETRGLATQPLTDLAKWLGELDAEAMASEGLTPTEEKYI
jgi:hypothetical protein